MKQLPGPRRPKWIQQLAAIGVAVVATIWLVTLLPVLLFVGLIAGLLLIPVLRQLKIEVEQLERRQRGDPPLPRDVTPWHRRVWNRWRGR
ncbi:MAG: hypothetical protein CBC50_05860 [Synechococcus sp. TMED90]|nr:MAG: hypothetical protein CBC50_05860 [Synechococcus sp. TMED90]